VYNGTWKIETPRRTIKTCQPVRKICRKFCQKRHLETLCSTEPHRNDTENYAHPSEHLPACISEVLFTQLKIAYQMYTVKGASLVTRSFPALSRKRVSMQRLGLGELLSVAAPRIGKEVTEKFDLLSITYQKCSICY
jgi:hypothetical protein